MSGKVDTKAPDVKKDVALDARVNIKEAFKRVEKLTRSVIDQLEPADAPHLVYALPVRDSQEQEGDVLVTSVRGEQAWDLALQAFERYYRLEDQHPMASYRLPGIVYVTNMGEVRPLIDELNKAKKTLKNAITSVPSGQRHRVTTETLPGVILLQVYRKIMAFDEDARRFVFSWAKRTSSSEKVTVEEVLARIEQDIKVKAAGTGELFADLSMAQLNGEKAMVEALDRREELRYYRPVSPHPRLMAFDQAGSPKPLFTYHANLPILTRWDPTTRVRELPDFLANTKPALQRRDHKAKTLLISRLNLYAINPA